MRDPQLDRPNQIEEHNGDMDVAIEEQKTCGCNFLITAFETFILIAFCVLEYFLRFTTVFPHRKRKFSCIDPDIQYKLETDPPFSTDIPEELIYALDFCVPIFVIAITEVIKITISDGKHKQSLKVVAAKIIRYTGTFIFGMVTLMVYIDVLKLMVGRLSPNFLEVCDVNVSLCSTQSNYGGDELCQQTNELALRRARSSFPSIFTGMSVYSALFAARYTSCALRRLQVRLLQPFFSFVLLMLAILCGLWEYGTNRFYWTDVVVSAAMGILLALFLCLVTLKSFEEPIKQDKLIHFFEKLIKDQQEENANDNIQRNRNLQRQRVIYSSPRTRWQHAVTSLQEVKTNDPELYNTFQRDLSKSIDHYKDRRNSFVDRTNIK